MLSILSQFAEKDCGHTSRRDFLKIGALGLGGLSLPSVLAAKAKAGELGSAYKGKSVVCLFLCGGSSQIEMFDPKVNIPREYRSTTGAIKTSMPGIKFGGTLPKLATQAHRMAMVRSYSPHQINDHATAIKEVLTAGHPYEAGMGAMTSKIRGANFLPSGMPNFSTLIEKEVDPQYQEDEARMRRGNEPGQLGPAFAPFSPSGGGQINDDMKLNLSLERLEDRMALREAMDKLDRQVDSSTAVEALDEYQQRAVDMILGGKVRKALDLSNEDPKVVAKYDTSDMQTGYLKTRPSTLGKRMLLARRLCEAGCGFVTVGSAGWDNHGNDKHPGVKEGMERLCPPFDHAVTAFLQDIHERGLEDDILLVVTSEFGRTPRISDNGGREHWPALCNLAFAGGGLNMGQVVGESTANGGEPNSEAYGMPDMFGTIIHTMFDVGQVRLQSGIPRELMSFIEEAYPIPDLV